jgi:hypothetical protein
MRYTYSKKAFVSYEKTNAFLLFDVEFAKKRFVWLGLVDMFQETSMIIRVAFDSQNITFMLK